MYEVAITKTAEKQLSKLERDVQKRILSSLERIRIQPYPHVKRLVGSPYFRLRVGQYRIILDIQEDKLFIYVIEVGDQKNIYK